MYNKQTGAKFQWIEHIDFVLFRCCFGFGSFFVQSLDCKCSIYASSHMINTCGCVFVFVKHSFWWKITFFAWHANNGQLLICPWKHTHTHTRSMLSRMFVLCFIMQFHKELVSSFNGLLLLILLVLFNVELSDRQ